MVVEVVPRGAGADREGKTGRRAFSQHVSIDLPFRLLGLRAGGSTGGADTAQLPAVVSRGEVSTRRQSLRSVSRSERVAGGGARMLSGKPPGDGGGGGDARGAPEDGQLANKSRCLYRPLGVYTAEIHRGRAAERIVVKPNFVAGDLEPKTQPGGYVLFVGRLSEEKGPQLLPSAWRSMPTKIPLRIVGDGPLLETLSREVRA